MFHEPFKMVFVSLAASVILLIGLFFYRFVYPKKKINLLALVILISILPIISIFRQGSYETGDLSLHTKLAMQFFENLQQGVFVPQWIPNHCYRYGCPVYIFLFILPYYFISFFHLFGLSFLASTKLLLMLAFISSGIGMYTWMKDEFGEKSGFVAAMFYLFAPYHLIDLSFRVSIGELVSMAILPFLFFSTKRLIETKQANFFVLNAVLFGLLILSHQVTSFISLPLLLLYSVVVWIRNKKRTLHALATEIFSLLTGMLLTVFYWLPIIVEGKYTKYGHDIGISFDHLAGYFYSPNRFGLLFQGHMGQLYFNIGYVQWIIIIVALYLFLRKKIQGKDKVLLGGALLLFGIFFFMMQPISKPIWDTLPLIRDFQFAWRLMIEIIFFVSIMAAIVAKTFPNNKFITFICVITILYTILNWGNRKTEPQINDAVLLNQPLFVEHPGKWGVEFTTPIWVDEYKPWIGSVPKSHMEVLSGKSQISEISRQVIKHEYIVLADTNTRLKENTFYYPGWEVLVNDHPVAIDYKNKKYPGVITFNINKGLYKIDVVFSRTTDRIIGDIISIISFTLLVLFIVVRIFIILLNSKKFQKLKKLPFK